MKFFFTKILILFSYFVFSQSDYSFIYLDGQKSKKNKIISNVEAILNKNNNVIFYMSDESVKKILDDKDSIKNQLENFPSNWRAKNEHSQVIEINNFFNNYDIFESLKSEKVLSNNINFYFFFNHFDFFINRKKTQANTIIDKILFTNNLFSFEKGKKILNNNCKIHLFLNYDPKDYYSRGESEEDIREWKKELENRLKELYNNNYEYKII